MQTASKVFSFQSLQEQARGIRSNGKKLVLCHGVFDLLHPGHLRHLQQAKKLGDLLMVTVTADRFVSKGPGRPVFPESLRAESLAALSSVDYVAVYHGPTAVPIIHALEPHVYVKGQDYKNLEQDITGNILAEKNAVESHGGSLIHTEEITFSSSSLINNYFDIFPPATQAYLKEFKQKYSAEEIIQQVQELRNMKVLVVGEAIIDEYCYTSPMGLTGKSGNIMATKFNSIEQFPGGSLAIANHLSGFVDHVSLLTGLGKKDRHEPFIRSRLNSNIQLLFHYYPEAPTLVKRRFVDGMMNKLFELYLYDEEPLSKQNESELVDWIEHNAKDYDLVIVPDYGNGFISDTMVQSLCANARFLAVNTQINSGNRGHHIITRYPKVDFVSINEPELRLAAHNRYDPLEEVAAHICNVVKAKQFAVTMGTEGAMILDNAQTKYHSPALSTKVVDRIGAGDAFLSFASLGVGGGMSSELSLFLGSAAAALDVQIICNRDPISQISLFKYITTLLK